MERNDISIQKIIKNNLQMIGTVYHTDAGYLFFTLFIRVLSGIRASFLYVYLLGFVLQAIENQDASESILLLLLLSTVLFAVAFALEAYYEQIFKPVHKERIVSSLQCRLFRQLQTADMANYDSAEKYTTVALASEEIADRPLAVADNLFRGLEVMAAACTILPGALSASPLVFAICLISFAAGIFLTNIRSKRIVQYDDSMKTKDKKISMLRRLLYLPEHARDNRLSHVHDAFLAEYEATVKDKEEIAANSGKRIARLSFLQKMFCEAFCIDFLIPFLLSGIVLVSGRLSISDFVIAVNASDQMRRRLEELTDVAAEFLKNGRFAERIHRINELQREIETTAGIVPVAPMETLSMRKVTFRYPDGTSGLSEVDLTIRKGSKVAIVGSNGSGKSTLIKLLLRFYDASSGEILLNGTDIRNLDIAAYRAQFGAAFQDFNLYATSIRNNVCMGEDRDEREEEDRLIRALEKAGLAEAVKDLDARLTRELDEDGVLFSGGQLQRLALARVFYRESDIVILDEPTAAMDVFFEKQFYRTVFETLKDKTVIFVSHRLSSVTACDKILYMEHGQIVEEGTHEHLMGLRGGYYRLFRAQFE